MKYFIFILFNLLVAFSPLFAQPLVWEYEESMFYPTVNMIPNIIIDSNNDIVSVVNEHSNSDVICYFRKVSQDGKLLSKKRLFYGNLLVPHGLFETEFGYKVLMGTADRVIGGIVADEEANSFPMIWNLDHNGDTINTQLPYDYNIDSIRNDYSLGTTSNLHRSLTFKNKFYNISSISKQIQSPSGNWKYTVKIVVFSCFNENGELIFRKQIDTISAINRYEIYRIKSFGNHLYTVFNNIVRSMDGDKSILHIFEFDEGGNITNQIELNFDKYVYHPNFDRLSNGNFLLYGDQKILTINTQGQLISGVGISPNVNGCSNVFMHITRNDKIYLGGFRLIKEEANPRYSVYRTHLLKLNNKFEIESFYEWNENIHDSLSGIREILFQNDSSIIALGFKDRYKFWIAKINLNPVSVENVENVNKEKILFPNPASNQIRINLEADRIPNEYRIVNSLGIIQNEADISSSQLTLDISAYPAGVYFAVFEYADGSRQVEKFIKIGE